MTRYRRFVVYLVLMLLLAAFALAPATVEAGVQWCRSCG